MARSLAERLGSYRLSDDRGEMVRLETLWEERPIVLAFVRHFG